MNKLQRNAHIYAVPNAKFPKMYGLYGAVDVSLLNVGNHPLYMQHFLCYSLCGPKTE